jgi:hypothetical protein
MKKFFIRLLGSIVLFILLLLPSFITLIFLNNHKLNDFAVKSYLGFWIIGQ